MINVSNKFRQEIGHRTDFIESAYITTADSNVLVLTESDFTLRNNSITDGSDSNGIPLGNAVCRSIQIEIANYNDEYSDIDFVGATIRLQTKLKIGDTVETIENGKFTVVTPETYGNTIIITAVDDMYKANRQYKPLITYPATLSNVLYDASRQAHLQLKSTNFLNSDYVVNKPSDDYTIRQIIGYVAMIACGNARIDRTGLLEIISYDFNELSNIYSNFDGGNFSYNTGYVSDGGTFAYNNGSDVDGGSFNYADINYHILSAWKNLKVDTDDVVITGISTEVVGSEETTVITQGTEEYMLQLKNPFFDGKEYDATRLIATRLIGGRFRKFSGDYIAYPLAEFMDYALVVDAKGNTYKSFITDVNFNFGGLTTIKNSAESALRNSSKDYSDATNTYVEARKLVQKEQTAREQAVDRLAQELSQSSGLFMTQEVQPDGSTIYYMHDKETLAQSQIVWKLTAEAFGISTDGGQTYPYGLDVSGVAILNKIYAEGIDADYITSGTIDATQITIKGYKSSSLDNDAKFQNTSGVTSIINGTVTTDFVNALGVKAKEFETSIINRRSSKTMNGGLYSLIDGVIVGGINSGYNAYINGWGSVLHNQGGSFAGIATGTSADGSDLTFAYYATPIKNYFKKDVEINGKLQVDDNAEFKGTNFVYKTSSKDIVKFTQTSVDINTSANICSSSDKLGFFGTITPSVKKNVSKITSTTSATASSCATKINEVIDALKAYNLL